MPRRTTTSQERPTSEQIPDYIETSTGRVGKREIARAFRLGGPDRIWLKSVLKELEQEATGTAPRPQGVSRAGRLPEVTVIRISHIDEDGEVVAHPVSWQDEDGDPPTIYQLPRRADAVRRPGSAIACWHVSHPRETTPPTSRAPSNS